MQATGVIIPLVTPLDDDENLDCEALERLLEYVIDAGVSGIFALGSTGEFPVLHDSVRLAAVQRIVEIVGRRVPVLVGVSAPGTRLAIENLETAQGCLADAVVVSPGYYYPQSDDELALHLRSVAKRSRLPVILYNIPQRVHRSIPLSLIEQLIGEGLVMGIKDSSGDMAYFTELLRIRDRHPAFRVLQGDEHLMLASVRAGADGLVPGIGNLAPHHCVQLFEASVDGRYEEAARWQQSISRLNAVFQQGSPYACLKAALHSIGICGPRAALPSLSPSPSGLGVIRQLISDAGVASTGMSA